MKTLLADSSPPGAARIMTLLESIDGCTVVGYAQSVPQVMADFESLTPDVVVLDLDLRGGTGISVLRQIKLQRPLTVVIVLTNASADQYRKRCMEIGADFFLDKSREFDRLPSIIRSLKSKGTVGKTI